MAAFKSSVDRASTQPGFTFEQLALRVVAAVMFLGLVVVGVQAALRPRPPRTWPRT